MSIIQSLKKLVDPIRARMEEADWKARIEETVEEHAGDPPTFVCRNCGYQDEQGVYCPKCLADTMVKETGK